MGGNLSSVFSRKDQTTDDNTDDNFNETVERLTGDILTSLANSTWQNTPFSSSHKQWSQIAFSEKVKELTASCVRMDLEEMVGTSGVSGQQTLENVSVKAEPKAELGGWAVVMDYHGLVKGQEKIGEEGVSDLGLLAYGFGKIGSEDKRIEVIGSGPIGGPRREESRREEVSGLRTIEKRLGEDNIIA
ncbi:uncharacterized protein L203_102271 [Cryptococcus depauperatus CBS 7841]|uniref:Uncharacterized protein n=1 Tax=Cryptococcus depauperatus CBS 7841 TaxID=1295531 RepID=A0A1E3HBE0_9TREE|nr:hypothetical protein L203_06680 [Cryptococcus depauperatus CBS 7841]